MTEITEGALLWTPRPEFIRNSNVVRFMDWLRAEKNVDLPNYDALWRWSVGFPEEFWATLWDHFHIESETPYEQVLDRRVMPGAKWFAGSRVNYAEHLLRHERHAAADETVFQHLSETRPLARMSWRELGRQVRILATQLRALGVQPGDAVVSYMPNVPETAIAMMATRHAVLITSMRASASSAAQRSPSLFIATSSSFVTLCMRIRLE